MIQRLTFLCVLALLVAPRLRAESVGVYVPFIGDIRVIQNAFKNDPAFRGKTVTVFSKFKDFKGMSKISKFDFAILPSSYGRYYKDYVAIGQLKKGDVPDQKYLLLSLKNKISIKNLAKGTVGLVDEVGRRKTKSLIKDLFAGSVFKQIKRVNKPVDLFPMLVLGNADFIIISQRNLANVKESKAYTIDSSEAVSLPQIYRRQGTKSSQDWLTKIKRETLMTLDFSEVEVFK
ncbi:MAG: hypothetical protein HRU19_24815 [Pseudobacteriovorax sp.]|nr:hypothetical protein [Pseudobacteriovorax sp.]